MQDLDPVEVRVLGCLLEKQQTTPDAYPLTLNSLRLACNQTTNRDPVTDYDEATVRDAAQRLGRRGLARMASYHGSRAAKYRHLVDEALGLAPDERALVCVLMLRGPQTLGELKQRTERMHQFADLAAVEAGLERLAHRDLARRLERRPGQKEARYTHLMEAEAQAPAPAAAPRPEPATCGEGLAENSVIPAALGELAAAMAEVLTVHRSALDPEDEDAGQEDAAYTRLADALGTAAVQLRTVATEMAGQRDLPMGRHDEEAMASPAAAEAFGRFVAAEEQLASLLRSRVEGDRAMRDAM